jgi:hypothetical protein
LINDIRSHRFLHRINNHHISNEDLILLSHIKIDL